MSLRALQDTWDALGRQDPFGAILEPLRGRDDVALDEFFASGEREIDDVLRNAERFGLPHGHDAALDFGCGAGRLTRAIGRRFSRCVGVDIAPSMIELASRLNDAPDRCTFVLNESDSLERFDGDAFDFVYSSITLQHIEPALARRYIEEFARVLRPGGLLVFQVPSGPDTAAIPWSALRAEIEPLVSSLALAPGASAEVRALVRHRGDTPWPADLFRRPIRLGNHWLAADGSMLRLDDGRTPLWRDVEPGGEIELTLTVNAPSEPGDYLLELDLVQEGVAWFADRGSTAARIPVRVATPGAPLGHLWGTSEAPQGNPTGAARPRRLASAAVAPARRLAARLPRRRPAESLEPQPDPPWEMHDIPREDVCALLEASGAQVVEVVEDDAAGPGRISLRYAATKP